MDNSTLVIIFRNLVDQFGKGPTGTYNPQDPTAFDNKKAYVQVSSQEQHENDEVWEIQWNNATWIETLVISKMSTTSFTSRMHSNVYLGDKQEWMDVAASAKTREYIMHILMTGTWIMSKREAEDKLRRIDHDQTPDIEEAVYATEDDRFYIALNHASVEHRRNEVDNINAYLLDRESELNASDNDKCIIRVGFQHIIVICNDVSRLMEVLEEVDEETIVWDITQANEYFEELS